MPGPGAVEPPEVVGWGWRAATERQRPVHGPRSRILINAIVIPCFVLAFLATAGFVAFVGSLDRFERSPAAGADGIVALTGGAQRIGDAIDLLAKGYGRRLLITGVNERTSRDEIARLNPGQRRLFDCCVDIDYRARNTIGNALETRRWMENQHFRSLIVVTSNYHMPRTLLELDSALPEARKVPFAVVNEALHPDAWWRSPATARLLASEYVKFLAGWVRTRMEKDPDQITTTAYAPVRIAAEPLAN
jgi:uncharacterized SAM-binding protein YcdF (DUF218 family)